MDQPGLSEQLLDFVRLHADGLGAPLLFLASLIEYVFPPFPGDLLVLLGAWLVLQGLWSFPLALGVVTAGSLAGALVGYWLGRWLGPHLEPNPGNPRRWWRPPAGELEKVRRGFRRWGPWLIAVNRFLPGIRAFFFLAAGASRMRLALVLALAALSALAWNTLLLAAGYALGKNWERLRAFFATYTLVAWLLLAGVVLALLLYYLCRRKGKFAKGGGEDEKQRRS